jgi:murein DD-endopeptidase MepM/ murein hydrolase activator NlpD
VALTRETSTIADVVPHDATFESLLRNNSVDGATANAIADALKGVFNPRLLRADRPYQLTRSLDGLFREFRYEIDGSKFLRIVRKAVGVSAEPEYAVEVVEYPREVELVAASAEISEEHNSLIGALDASGENIQLALSLAEIFGGELDFNSDLQRGDKFDVLFERVMRDGQFAGYGDLSGAVLHHDGRVLTAIRAQGPDGKFAWYDEQGRSMKRQFLKSPLAFNPTPRVTSGFSMSRKHPLFGFNRAHLGVDYGAAYGAPVVAVTAGTVVSADWAGQGGREVHLRHSGGYETYYLHLSAFAPGLRPGAHVEQGELIGRVGASGAATGPHLDFRIRRNGTFVNPVLERQRMPPGEPIPSSMLAAFRTERDQVLADLAKRLSANLLRSAEH